MNKQPASAGKKPPFDEESLRLEDEALAATGGILAISPEILEANKNGYYKAVAWAAIEGGWQFFGNGVARTPGGKTLSTDSFDFKAELYQAWLSVREAVDDNVKAAALLHDLAEGEQDND